MMSRLAIRIVLAFVWIGGSLLAQGTKERPNVIIIFTDDQGYQDLGCFGSPDIATPHLDQMAQEGVKLSSFYVSSSICSPSRASILTGRLPFRNGVKSVFFPNARGMNPEEFTLAELLKQANYRTACIGKWHLGDRAESLPLAQGFDEYYGIPYSNDMFIGPHHVFAHDVKFLKGYSLQKAKEDQYFVRNNNRQAIKTKGIKGLVPLFEGDSIVEYPTEQATLTRRYFDRAMKFIEDANDDPFFIYLTPAMPHVPLFASSAYLGKSKRGLYGDVIEEIDGNVGRLLSFLKKKGLGKNTMVIFTSDNGPWLGKGKDAGATGLFRDGKFSLYEGGVRVPCIVWWPGTWEQGKTSPALVSSMDLFPTIASYASLNLDKFQIDGKNLAGHLENLELFPISNHILVSRKDFFAIRKGDWKYLPNGGHRKVTKDSLPELYHLGKDVSESENLYLIHQDKANELGKLIQSTIRNKD